MEWIKHYICLQITLEKVSELLERTVSERRANGRGHLFCVKICCLYKVDLKGNKEVIDGVKEGDKTHCGKRKFAKEEYTQNKLNKYRK
jgi:hypothetical protein